MAHVSGSDEAIQEITDTLENTKLRFAASLEHVWWGVSVEDRAYGVPRINHLQSIDAKIRFLSVEPLLEDLGVLDLARIHWMIVGGESGPGARPMKKEWVLGLRDQCRQAEVPFFFKQWGGTRKSVHGRRLNGLTYDEFPKRVRNPVAGTAECTVLARSIEAAFGSFYPIGCLA